MGNYSAPGGAISATTLTEINNQNAGPTLQIQGDVGGSSLLVLSTKETTIVDGDVIGALEWQAQSEADGSDAILACAKVHAEADATFTGSVNKADLVFSTSTSGAPSEAMRITHESTVGIGTSTPKGTLHVVTTGADDAVISSNAVNEINGLLIESTHTNDTGSSPMIAFHRNGSDNATNADRLANVIWIGDNDAGQHLIYAQWKSYIVRVNDGSESGGNSIQVMTEGTNRAFLNCYGDAKADGDGSLGGLLGPEVAINEGSADIDFRVESNNNDAMLFVDGGSDVVGIGTSTPANKLDVRHSGADGKDGIMVVRVDATTTDGEFLGGIGFDSTDGNVPSTVQEASAFIGAFATEDHGTGDKGGCLKFGVTNIDDDDDTSSRVVANVGPPDTTANATVHPGLNSRATTAFVAAATYAPTLADSGILIIFNHANSNLTLPSINSTGYEGVQFTVFNNTGSAINAQIAVQNSATINGGAASSSDDIASYKAATFIVTGNNTWARIG